MKKYTHEKSFVFQNEAEGLASVARSCVQYIEEQNEFLCIPADIHSRIKWTITELLINGAKHSGAETSCLNLKFSESYLTIEKEDEGIPLHLHVDNGTQRLQWPLEESLIQRHFEVYRNGMDSLCVYTENKNVAVFSVKEVEDEAMPLLLVNTSEHFGLMIIAKASDHFSYVFDTLKRSNIFIIIFDYIQ